MVFKANEKPVVSRLASLTPDPANTIRRRSLPRAIYHVTTERHWEKIQSTGVIHSGRGEGWTERQGVFAVGWRNWLANLHYLAFLTPKLSGKSDKLVVLKIRMTPALRRRTKVALLSSIETAAGKMLLDNARKGLFSTIADADQVEFVPSRGKVLIRSTFKLSEFVKAVPASRDPIEYIIEVDGIALTLISKFAEVKSEEIPANYLAAGKRLVIELRERRATGRGNEYRPSTVTEADRQSFASKLRASHRRLGARVQKQ